MYCKYLSKSLNGKIKCRLYKRYIISLLEYKNALKTIVERMRGINEVNITE